MKYHKIRFVLLILLPVQVTATEYYCEATQKHDFGITYGEETIYQAKWATKVEELDNETFLSRCSMDYKPETPKITCDRYKVDKLIFDEISKIKKYYVFRAQFDFQIFPNMNSLENNGRGSIQYGKCKIVSP